MEKAKRDNISSPPGKKSSELNRDDVKHMNQTIISKKKIEYFQGKHKPITSQMSHKVLNMEGHKEFIQNVKMEDPN